MADKNYGHNENKNLVNLDEWVKQYMSDSQQDVADLKEKVEKMWDTIYPVGSIYLTTTSTNPAGFWGGTWVLWGQGRVPVGYNGSDTDFSKVEKVGGEKRHTLTVAEMPSHRHTVDNHTTNSTSSKTDGYVMRGSYSGNAVPCVTDYVGGGSSHNVMQPYIVCYMWKRTA